MGLILDFLEEQGVGAIAMSRQDAVEFEDRWLQAFAQRVHARHGVRVYRGYRWHGFSYRLQPCVTGDAALAEYMKQWSVEYVVFGESLSEAYRCQSGRYPDLTPLGDDVYVSHGNLKWTMVFTHEQPQIGPFFALRDDG